MSPTAPSASALALALLAACPSPGAGNKTSASEEPTAEGYRGPPLPQGRVVLRDAYGGTLAVKVEVAASADARTRGLMWRTSLAPGAGMLFVFAEEGLHPFWMKNTLIPLDMIFIAADRTIVGIVSNAEPRSTSPRGPPRASRFVLEVPGGWVERTGIQTGGAVQIELQNGLKVEP